MRPEIELLLDEEELVRTWCYCGTSNELSTAATKSVVEARPIHYTVTSASLYALRFHGSMVSH